MEFRHLRYFVAVAETLHFRKASESLHIAQPALSQQIKKLEDELGFPLFDRSSRSVQLTVGGQAFLPDARRLLEMRDETVQAARSRATGQRGTLRAAYVGPAAYSVLHPILSAYREHRPHVDLRLSEMTNTEQLDALRTGMIDVGIVRTPINDGPFHMEDIFEEPVVVILPSGHELARRRSIPLPALASERFITVPRTKESSVFDSYVSLCHAAGFSPHVVQEAPLIHTIVEMVSAGLGIALAPRSIRSSRRPGVVYRPVCSTAQPTVSTGLIWRDDHSPAAVHKFINIAREAASSISA